MMTYTIASIAAVQVSTKFQNRQVIRLLMYSDVNILLLGFQL